MSRRVLVPYLSAGLGHLLTAEAIGHYLRTLQPDWDVRLADLAKHLGDRRLHSAYEDSWKRVLKMPVAAARIVLQLDNVLPRFSEWVHQWAMATAIPKAVSFLDDFRPDLILSAHWACTRVFARARAEAKRSVPLWYVYGELGAGYRSMNCGADLYFCLTAAAHKAAQKLGVPADRILDVPLLIHPQFLDSGLTREEAKRNQNLPLDRLAVLMSFGGEGIGLSLQFIERFLSDVEGATLVVLTGKNADLLEKIRSTYPGPRVTAIGYRPYIGDIVAAADVLAGKCGANYAMLAVKRGIPLLVTRLGGPNERPNMRYIVDNGFGFYCPKPREFAQCVSELADPDRYRQACSAFQSVEPQNGAEVIAERIVEHLE